MSQLFKNASDAAEVAYKTAVAVQTLRLQSENVQQQVKFCLSLLGGTANKTELKDTHDDLHHLLQCSQEDFNRQLASLKLDLREKDNQNSADMHQLSMFDMAEWQDEAPPPPPPKKSRGGGKQAPNNITVLSIAPASPPDVPLLGSGH